MRDISARDLLSRKNFHAPDVCKACRTTWHYWESDWAPKDSSYFEARYLLGRPRAQQPWNGNISALFNHLLDRIYEREDQPVTNCRRYRDMLRLCKTLRLRQVPEPKRLQHEMIPWLYPPDGPITSQSEEFLVAAAHMLLGREQPALDFVATCDPGTLTTEDEIFGTLLQAAVRSGNVALVRQLLERGLDVNDHKHLALETALQNDDEPMVRLLLDPRYDLHVTSHTLIKSTLTAIKICRPKTIHAMIDHASSKELLIIARYGFRIACRFGYISIARRFLEDVPGLDIESHRYHDEQVRPELPLVNAVGSGNVEMVKLLIDRGLNPWGIPEFRCKDLKTAKQIVSISPYGAGTMSRAARFGDIEMAKVLLKAGLWLPPRRWMNIIVDASMGWFDDFVDYLVNSGAVDIRSILAESPGLVRQTIRYFCKQGNPNGVRLFASHGVPMNAAFYAGESTPMEVAMSYKYRDVATALVEAGAEKVVDLESIQQRERYRECWWVGHWYRGKAEISTRSQ